MRVISFCAADGKYHSRLVIYNFLNSEFNLYKHADPSLSSTNHVQTQENVQNIFLCGRYHSNIFLLLWKRNNARHQQQQQPAFFVLCVLNAFLCHPLVCWSTFSCCPRFHLASKSKQGPFQVFRPKAKGGQRALAGGHSVVAEIPPTKLRQGSKAPYRYL